MTDKMSLHAGRSLSKFDIDWKKFHQEYVGLIKEYEDVCSLTASDLKREMKDPQRINYCLSDESDGSLTAIAQASRFVFRPWQQLHINRLYVRSDMLYRGLGHNCLFSLEKVGLAYFSRTKQPYQFLVSLSPRNRSDCFFLKNGYELAYQEGELVVYVKNV